TPILADPGFGLSMGQVPWWINGPRALEITSSGAREILMQPSEARMNSSETRGRVAFDEPGLAACSWSTKGGGQNALSDRLSMRAKALEARRRRLDEMCGASPGFDVQTAEAAKLDDPGAPFEIACAGGMQVKTPSPDEREWSFKTEGPWI